MKNNVKAVWTVAKINFRQLLPAYIITAVFVAVGIYNLIACLTGATDNYYVDMANYLYVLVVIAPIIISVRNFKKIMHLNGKKQTFFWGALLNYSLIAAGVSLTVIFFFVCTKSIFGSRLIINNLADIFGWWEHGAAIAFVQQFLFLLLVEIFVHTLMITQNRWYGWVLDGILIFILAVFIPIPELRNVLIGFFNLIIFHTYAPIQMLSCLVLLTAGYLVYLPILRRKEV